MANFRPKTSLLMVLALIAGTLVASEPARAVDITSARVSMLQVARLPSDRSWVYDHADGDAFALLSGAGNRGLSWSRDDGSEAWSISIGAPVNGPLTVGRYLNARGEVPYHPIWPKLRLSRDSVPCDDEGHFTISQLQLHPDGSLQALDMTFEHHCMGAMGTTYGRIQVNVALSAPAAGSGPAVLFTGNPSSPDSGIVWAFTTANPDISRLTARIVSPATGEQVAVNNFNRLWAVEANGLMAWYTSIDHLVSQPGIYRVDTELTTTAGATVTQTDAGRHVFDMTTTVLDLRAGEGLHYQNRTTSVRGTLRKIHPRTRIPSPVGGAAVKALVRVGDAVTEVNGTTDAQGEFLFTLSSDVPVSVRVIYEGSADGLIRRELTYEVSIPFLQSESTMAVSPSTFLEQTTTVSGTATFALPYGGTEPLAHTPIEVWDMAWGEQRLATTVTTDAEGRFSFTHTARFWPDGWVQLVARSTDVFIASTSAMITLRPYHAGVVIELFVGSWVTPSVAEFAALLTIPGTPPPGFAFELQYQTANGWQTYGTTTPIHVPELGPDVWVTGLQVEAPCGTSVWRLAYGLQFPGREVISESLTAFRGCSAPRRPPGSRMPTPPRR